MALRDGIVKVLRGGVTGAEKITHAAFGGLRKGIDWLDKPRSDNAGADASDASGAGAGPAGDGPADSV
jgi:hypothetical protein